MNNLATSQMNWSYFGEIRCINLLEREDRYLNAKKVFDSIPGLNVNFFRTRRHPKGGTIGCYESHMACIRQAYDEGCETVLIFEDDIYAVEPKRLQRGLEEAINFMQATPDWEIFFLGCVPEIIKNYTTKIDGHKDVYKVHAFGGHAYVLHRRYMAKVLQVPFIDHAIDGLYAVNESAYAILPSLFYQGNFGTDIQKMNSGPIKDMGIKFVEMYSTGANVPTTYVFLILLVLFVLLVILYAVNPKDRLIWFVLLILIGLVAISVIVSNQW